MIVAAGTLLAPVLAGAWDGKQLDTEFAIDLARSRSEVVLDIASSGFLFDPVVVTVKDKPGRSTKIVTLHFRIKNLTDDDYFVFASATLLDAEGNAIAAKTDRDKIEEDDPEKVAIRFKLPYEDAERLATAKARFGFEED